MARLIVMQLGMNSKVGLVNLKRTRENQHEPFPLFSDATAQVSADPSVSTTNKCVSVNIVHVKISVYLYSSTGEHKLEKFRWVGGLLKYK